MGEKFKQAGILLERISDVVLFFFFIPDQKENLKLLLSNIAGPL